MAADIVGNAIADELVNKIANLTRLFQAIGGLIIAYIVFSIINLITNRRRRACEKRMVELLESIDRKLGKK